MGELHPAERINRLIDSLSEAPYVNQHQLLGVTIEELGNRLFEEKEKLTESPLANVDLDKCIHDYCLLLQELENEHLTDFNVQTLAELRGRETKTKFIHAVPDLNDVLEGKNTVLDWGSRAIITPAEPSAESVATEWRNENSPAISSPEENELDQALESLSQSKIELAPETEDLPPLIPIPPNEKDSPIDLPVLAANPSEETISKWVELPPKQEVVADAEFDVPLFSKEDSIPATYFEAGSPIAKSDAHDHAELDSKSQQYWKSGEALFSHPEMVTLPHDHRTRLASVCFSLTIEKTLFEKLGPTLFQSWTERAIPIVTSLDTENRRFGLKPRLKEFLDTLANQHSLWLPEGKLPQSGIINSLRYILATEETEKFRPSLLDWGVVLFWFGSKAERGGVKLPNLLGLTHHDDALLFETVFRLFRLNKLRMRALSAGQPFDDNSFFQLKEDASRLSELLAKFEFGEPESVFEQVG